MKKQPGKARRKTMPPDTDHAEVRRARDRQKPRGYGLVEGVPAVNLQEEKAVEVV